MIGEEIAVVADDLTGAMDTGAQFSRLGAETIVYLNGRSIETLNNIHPRSEITVVDADTRLIDPKQAYEATENVCRVLKANGVKRIYKKIDSTLRGNIGAELDAVMDVWSARVAYVVPAFPDNNRLTVGGYQLIGDRPIEDTEIATDLLSPVRKSHIPSLLQSQSSRKVGYVPLDIVKQGHGVLLARFREELATGNNLLVIDAATNEHLEEIAKAIAQSEFQEILCGSAGLASKLPQAFNLSTGRPRPLEKRSQPVLVVSGSRSMVTGAQVRYLVDHYPVKRFCLGLGEVADLTGGALEAIADQAAHDAIQAIRDGVDVVIAANSERVPKVALGAIDLSRTIVKVLGGAVRRILDEVSLSGVVLTGGDTAAAACRASGVSGIAIKDEILPGIPVGTFIGGPHEGARVVTKAGAFGTEDALVKVIEYLRLP